MATHSGAHVSLDGRILRPGDDGFHRIQLSKVRLISVLVAAILFYCTNPANPISGAILPNAMGHHASNRIIDLYQSKDRHRHTGWGQKGKSKSGSYTLNYFGYEIKLSMPDGSIQLGKSTKKVKNYGFLALRQTEYGLGIALLGTEFSACHYSFDESDYCEMIAKNLCHDMSPFDRHSRPYTIVWVLATLNIIFTVLSFCTMDGCLTHQSIPTSMSYIIRKPHAVIYSTVLHPYESTEWSVIIWILYPTLTALEGNILDRLLGSGLTGNYYNMMILLLLGIGGVVNTLGSIASEQHTRGILGGTAATLGYMSAVSPYRMVVKYSSGSLHASDILYAVAIGMVLSIGLTKHRVGVCHGGHLVAWILGGMAGHLIGLQ